MFNFLLRNILILGFQKVFKGTEKQHGLLATEKRTKGQTKPAAQTTAQHSPPAQHRKAAEHRRPQHRAQDTTGQRSAQQDTMTHQSSTTAPQNAQGDTTTHSDLPQREAPTTAQTQPAPNNTTCSATRHRTHREKTQTNTTSKGKQTAGRHSTAPHGNKAPQNTGHSTGGRGTTTNHSTQQGSKPRGQARAPATTHGSGKRRQATRPGSEQPQTTNNTTQHQPARTKQHGTTAAYRTRGGKPEKRSAAPQAITQPRATTGDHETATGGSTVEQEPSPTQAPHTAPGTTQNTPTHTTGNNTHRTGIARVHSTTQQHTSARPAAQDTQTSPGTAQPARQGREKKGRSRKRKGKNKKNKENGRGEEGGGKKKAKRRATREDHRAPEPTAPWAGNQRTQGTMGRRKKKNTGEGAEDHKTPRAKATRAGKHGTPETAGGQKKTKEENTQQQPQTGQPKPGGGQANKRRTKTGHRER